MSLDEIHLKKEEWQGKIAERLVALRVRRQLNTSMVARATQISRSSIQDYEVGRAAIPAKRLVILARFYDCSIDFILLGLGWGGVEVADYDALIHSLPDTAPAKLEAQARQRGPGVKVKKEPVTPRAVKVSKPKPKAKTAKKAAESTPVQAPARKRKSKMMYDFSL